jgi:hypothetical protein
MECPLCGAEGARLPAHLPTPPESENGCPETPLRGTTVQEAVSR